LTVKIADFIGEATEYDKKERLEERRPKSWLKSVSAFAGGRRTDMERENTDS